MCRKVSGYLRGLCTAFFLIFIIGCYDGNTIPVELYADSRAVLNGGETLLLEAKSAVPAEGTVYTWRINGEDSGETGSSLLFSKNPIFSESFRVEVEVIRGDRAGRDEMIIEVKQSGGPRVSILEGSQVTLHGETAHFTASVISAAGEFAELQWSLDGEPVEERGAMFSVALAPQSDQIFNIEVKARDSSGTTSDSVALKVLGPQSVEPAVVVSRDSWNAFYGYPLQLSAAGVHPLGRELYWEWFIDQQSVAAGIDLQSISHLFTPAAESLHRLKVRVSSGDQVAEAESVIVAHPEGTPALTIVPGDRQLGYRDLEEGSSLVYTALVPPELASQVVWFLDGQELGHGEQISLAGLPRQPLSYRIEAGLDWNGILAGDEVYLSVVESPLAEVVHDGRSGTFVVEQNLGAEGKDLYLLFTNTGSTESRTAPQIRSFSQVLPSTAASTVTAPAPVNPYAGVEEAEEVTRFNASPPNFYRNTGLQAHSRSIAPAAQIGDRLTFMDYRGQPVPATLRSTSESVGVADGSTRRVDIWVEDASWESGGSKPYLINQTMSNKMQELFLKSGSSNDIYDWMTAITGSEWGAHDYTNLIPADGTISILLCDINNDSSVTGGVIGYFSSANNYLQSSVSFSNEKLMFCIDSVLYAKDEGGSWEWTDRWPAMLISTLAHEFQHMIHFYRKRVLAGNPMGSETWLDELCSLASEDLLADKLGIASPASGRLNGFVSAPETPVTRWLTGFNVLDSYATAYSFGTYLIRNFGGPRLLYNIVNNSETGFLAVEEALFATGFAVPFERALQSWGAANILSSVSQDYSDYSINRAGGFHYEFNGVSWFLENQDLFDYYFWNNETGTIGVGPKVVSDPLKMRRIEGHANEIFLAGKNLKGKQQWEVTLPPGVELTVVVK